ncbi:uncharacterized protein LOC128929302 isoform X1 [Callithrix jacchus]
MWRPGCCHLNTPSDNRIERRIPRHNQTCSSLGSTQQTITERDTKEVFAESIKLYSLASETKYEDLANNLIPDCLLLSNLRLLTTQPDMIDSNITTECLPGSAGLPFFKESSNTLRVSGFQICQNPCKKGCQ